MAQFTVSREVAAPASTVWDIITNLETMPQTIAGIESVEILEGGDTFGVGTRWRETRRMFGKQATEEMWVVDVSPGASYVANAESHGSKYTTVMRVSSSGTSASTVSMEFGSEPTGTLAKIMAATLGRLFAGAIKKMLASDLDDIAIAAAAKTA